MMKKIIFALLLLWATQNIASAQKNPEKFGLQSFSITDDSLGRIDYHISANGINERKPVLLYLDGSGAFPLFQYMEKGTGSSVPFDINALSKKYHIVLISKPGVPLADSVKRDVAGGLLYPTPDQYIKKLSLQWRAKAADLVLKEVIKNYQTDSSRIVVLGISEGFQAGAKLISLNRSVTHAMLIVGNGLNQLFDFIIHNRLQAAEGLISAAQAQQNIDSLFAQYKQIYANPKSTDKSWYGHTYLRWADFSNAIPLESLLHTDIPVLIVAAADDKNTTALSTDYLYLESLRKGKANIFYKVYPFNHMMQEEIKDEKGNITGMKNHMRTVLDESFEWVDKR